MKKLLLGLGTLAASAMPVATIVSCSLTKPDTNEKIKKLEQKTLEDLKEKEIAKIIEFKGSLTANKIIEIEHKINSAKTMSGLLEIVSDLLTESGKTSDKNIGTEISNELATALVDTATKANEKLKVDTQKLKTQSSGTETSGQKTQLTHYHIDKAIVGKQTKTITLSPEATKTLDDVIKKSLDEQNAFQITNTGSGKDFFKLPEKLILGGSKQKAQLPDFKAPVGTSLNFFKMTGPSLVSISQGTEFSLGTKDRVIIMVKKGSNWVNGKSYAPLFASVPEQFSSFEDGGLGDKIKNGTFDMDSITDFVNSKLLPGQTYTSSLAGQNTSMKMPELDASLRPADAKPGASGKRVFSPFIDASMAQTTFDADTNAIDNVAKKYESVTMAFMQNGSTVSGDGSGSWGGTVALDSNTTSSYYKLMDAMRKHGHDFIVSFGGAVGSPIWKKADPVLLAGFLANFAEQYNINTFDYDIEGGEVADAKAVGTLSLATAIAQKALAKKGRVLNINLTIPSETGGLAPAGETVLQSFISSGVDVNILNGMAMMMNKGITQSSGGLPGVYRQHTIDGLVSQLKAAYAASKLEISDEALYGKIGITFDISTDTWTPEQMHSDADLVKLRKTFDDKKIGFVGYWSLNNDDDAISGLGAPTFGAGNAYKELHSYADGTGKIPQVQNPLSNDFTKKAFSTYYSKDILGGTAISTGEKILPEGNTDAIPGGTKIKWKNPDDGAVHIYQAAYWAESDQRPDTPATSGQFVDLGPISSGTKITPAIKTLLSQFSPFGVKGNSEGGGDSVTGLFATGTSSVIKPYDDTTAYNKPFTLVIYKGGFWTNSFYANPGTLSNPTKWGPWHKIS